MAAGGDLAGSSYPNPVIAPGAVSSGKLASNLANMLGSDDVGPLTGAEVFRQVSNVSGSLTALAAGNCTLISHPLAGVLSGDIAVPFAFVGANWPAALRIDPLATDTEDQITMRYCNSGLERRSRRRPSTTRCTSSTTSASAALRAAARPAG